MYPRHIAKGLRCYFKAYHTKMTESSLYLGSQQLWLMWKKHRVNKVVFISDKMNIEEELIARDKILKKKLSSKNNGSHNRCEVIFVK